MFVLIDFSTIGLQRKSILVYEKSNIPPKICITTYFSLKNKMSKYLSCQLIINILRIVNVSFYKIISHRVVVVVTSFFEKSKDSHKYTECSRR